MSVPLSPETPFPEWMPDLGSYQTSASIAKNCFSYGGVYKPIPQLQSSSDAVPDRTRGAFTMRASDGTTHIFSATLTNLYKLNGAAWDDVTRSAGDYTTSSDGYWIFVNFGDLVIATNYNDDIQVFDVLADTEFSQLSATAPRARHIFILNNFLVGVDIVDSDGNGITRVRWSPLGDPEGDWTPSIDTQAGFQDLFGGGFINTAGTGNQTFGTIIQDSAIWRMEYTGGDTIFTFSQEVQERGTKLARSVRTNGTSTYFLDEDGFYSFDGRQAVPVGRNKVDKWFYGNFNSSYDYFLSSAIDPINRVYAVSFPTVGAGSDIPQLVLLYNEVDGRWTYLEQEMDLILEGLSVGLTLEQLSALYPVIEDVPYSFDSKFWQGGRFLFSAIDSNHKLASFNGEPYEALIGTVETRISQNGKATISGLQPIVEAGTVEARIGYRDKITDAVTYTDYVGVNGITGEIDIYINSRFFRAEFKISDDWDKAKGFAYRAKQGGIV